MRELKLFFVLVVCLMFSALPAHAKKWKIAVFTQDGFAGLMEPMVRGFREGLQACGFKDGVNVTYSEERIYSADEEGGEAAASDTLTLLDKGVDLFVTLGTAPSVGARKVLMRTHVPQIYMCISDPIGAGFIDDYGQPSGSNITGVSYVVHPQREISFVRRVLPNKHKYRRFLYSYDTNIPADLARKKLFDELIASGDVYDFEIIFRDISTQEARDGYMKVEHPDPGTGWLGYIMHRKDGSFVEPNAFGVGLTTEYAARGWMVAGICIDNYALGRQAAVMAAKVISGTEKIENIPAEDPHKTKIMVNLAAANKLGVTIPFDVTVEADKIFSEMEPLEELDKIMK